MSYCRFSSGDVYMFAHINGGIECCSCGLAPLIPTIWTKGTKALPEGDGRRKLFGETGPHEDCNGEGCKGCMMHDSLSFPSRTEAIDHLIDHMKHGHEVPLYAVTRLQEEIEEIGDIAGLEVPDEPRSPITVIRRDPED